MAVQLPNVFDECGTEFRVLVDFEPDESRHNKDRQPVVSFAMAEGGPTETYFASTVLECSMAGGGLLIPSNWADGRDISFPASAIRSVANGLLQAAPYPMGEFSVSWAKRSPDWHLLPF